MKDKSARQTVCNEPGKKAKQNFCGGFLKQINHLEMEIARSVAKNLDVFRCQDCGALYTEQSPYATPKR